MSKYLQFIGTFFLFYTFMTPVFAHEETNVNPHPSHFERDIYIKGYVEGLLAAGTFFGIELEHVENGHIYLKVYINEDSLIERFSSLLKEHPLIEKVSTQIVPIGQENIPSENAPKNAYKRIILPNGPLFSPLLADPKWPRFSLAYHYNWSNFPGRHIFAPAFGGHIPLYKRQLNHSDSYEIGVMAGLFAILNMGTNPTKLINADYYVAPTLSYQSGPYSYLFRISHTSGHLGDEFMLSDTGKTTKRINLSYETVEGIMAYTFSTGIRPYVGIGYIVHAEPTSYQSFEFMGGIDFKGSAFEAWDYLKPVAGFMVKTSKNHKWNPYLSIKAGVGIENPYFDNQEIQIVLEYFIGHSVNGQFYHKKEQYIGISMNIFM